MLERRAVEGVQHPALAARPGPLDLLARRFLRHRVKGPGFRRRVGARPVARRRKKHFSIGGDGVGQVYGFAARPERHERLRGAAFKLLFEPFARTELEGFDDEPRIGLGIGDVRPAEAPAGAEGHVHAQAAALRLAHRPVEHLHPARRQVGDGAVFPALGAVDRDDVQPAEAGVAGALDLAGQVGLIHRAAHPPPVGPRPRCARDRRPRQRISRLRCGAASRGQQQRRCGDGPSL